MKAAVYYENGPPSVLRYEDVPDPECHPKGVVIRVEVVSIEGGDTLSRAGGSLASRPHVVGYQAAGEIVEVGSEVTHLRVGQKVTTVNAWGSHAERSRAGCDSAGQACGCVRDDRAHDMIQRHIDDVAAGKLEVVIDSEYALADAAAAHAHIEGRGAFGRVLLIP